MGIAYDRFALPTLAPARLDHRALRALPLTALGLDIALVSVTIFFAALGRNRLDLFGSGATVSHSAALVALPLAVAWIVIIALRGGYDRGVFGAGADEYKIVVGSSFFAAAFLGIGCYLLQFELSRGFYIFTFLIGPALLAIGRWTLRRWLHQARRHGSFGLRTVIVGSGDHGDAVASVFARESWLGYDVLGALTPASESTVATDGAVRVLGDVHEAAALARAYDADVVVVAGGGFENPTAMRELVWDLEADEVQVIMAPGVTDVSSERIRVRPVGGLPLLHLDRPRSQEALRWAKRAFDIAGSATLLALSAPLLLWTAWQVKRYDGGPVLFRQTRVGNDGSFFTCLKFRSMVVDAERVLAELHAQTGHS